MGGDAGVGRVSTPDENPDGQHHALKAAGCAEIPKPGVLTPLTRATVSENFTLFSMLPW